jgi:8-amino-7-oxononanoate synthase
MKNRENNLFLQGEQASTMYSACYESACEKLRKDHKYRILPDSKQLSEKSKWDFASNDYLGLSKDASVLKAAYEAALAYGVGATGSRLLSGNPPLFEELENTIAQDKQTESALIFNSGYQANLSVLATLTNQDILGHTPLLLFDKLNHASLYQAALLSGAELKRYPHLDMNRLEHLLKTHRTQTPNRAIFVVSETVFGMDGDIAPLSNLIDLCHQYSAFLYLDEAHATGLFGKKGYGLSTNFDLKHIEHVIMGTFSKAIGCSGAYIACSQTTKSYLTNYCSGFIYSTALSPMVIGAVNQAWKMIPDLTALRQQLFKQADLIRSQLQKEQIDTGKSTTHILPILLKEESVVMASQKKLHAQGVLVSAIRPPTVPPKTARLRIAINKHHLDLDVDELVSVLIACIKT